MQSSNVPTKVFLPFANSGTKNAIPTASQIGIVNGAASLTDGFPPLTFTPLNAGGVPPAGADFNGILNLITAVQRWQCAGGVFRYDAAFSTAIGGYPKGCVLNNIDNDTEWLSIIENNTNDPDSLPATGWVTLASYGVATVAMSNANVTLTPSQYSKNIIIVTGTLTQNVQLIFPTVVQQWRVMNNTTGAFTLTCKTATGAGALVAQASTEQLYQIGGDLLIFRVPGRLLRTSTYVNVGAGLVRSVDGKAFVADTGSFVALANTVFAEIEVIGGGGAGGGTPVTSAGNVSVGAGGAAGGTAKGTFATGFATATITAGVGGTGVAGANGNPGGASSFGTLLSCGGGGGGAVGANIAPGFFYNGGGGGGGGVTAANGAIIAPGEKGFVGFYNSTPLSGTGGSSTAGSGGSYVLGNSIGQLGNAVGSGGSGAASTANGATFAGGTGVYGIVTVKEYS